MNRLLFLFSAFLLLGRVCLARPRSAARAAVENSAELIDLLKSLASLQSTTRTGNPDTDERQVQQFIETWIRNMAESNGLQINIDRIPVTEGRDNLYVYTGTKKNTRVMLSCHVDTVPPHFDYYEEGDKIYGRGTADAKGSVAAMMIAYRNLLISKQVKQEGDLSLLLVVGEEIGGEGMTVVEQLGMKWDAVIFGDPTDNKLASGQIGGVVFNVTATGKAFHSAFPERGVNAIEKIRKVMDALHRVVQDLPNNPAYGQKSLTIGQIAGGVADNAVPAGAWVSGSFRLTSPTSEVTTRLGRFIKSALCPKEVSDADIAYQPCDFITIDYPLEEDPMSIDHDVPDFESFGARFGSDISLLTGDHKKYLYGPGSILVAHTPDEFVSKRDVIQAAKDYETLVKFNLGLEKQVGISSNL